MPGMSQTGDFHDPFVQFRPLGVDRAFPFKNKSVPGRTWQPDPGGHIPCCFATEYHSVPFKVSPEAVDDISSRVDPALPFPLPILSCGLIEEVDIVLRADNSKH